MKNKNLILIFIISFIILYFTLKDNFAEKIGYLFSFDIKWVILSFALMMIYVFLKGVIIYCCVFKVNKNYTLKKGILLMITTQFFHGITPFASGGQPWQIYKLKKDGLSLGEATNVVLQDFIVYQITLVFLGVIAIISNYVFHIFPSDSLLRKLVTAGFIINTLVIIILFVVAFSQKWNKKIIKMFINLLSYLKIIKDKNEKIEKTGEFIKNFHQSATILFKDKINMFKTIILNLIALISQYLIPFALLMGCNIYINPLVIIVASAYVMLVGAMVPMPGGSGGVEYSFISFYQNFINGPELSVIMIVWRVITYYFTLLIGGLVLNFNKEAR